MADTVRRLRCGPGAGRLVIRTRREGFAARAGHDLTIEITRWFVDIDVPGDDRAGASIVAEIDLDSLAVREGTGGAMPLTAEDRGKIETTARQLIGGGSARFESTGIAPTGDGATIDGTLTMRGTGRPVRLAVQTLDGDRYRATAVVRQSAYGIRPYSAFLGALKLRDEIAVEVEVDLTRATARAAGSDPTAGPA
ncbi:MAG TPA: YceI family protein [Rugosimonospora sp.]